MLARGCTCVDALKRLDFFFLFASVDGESRDIPPSGKWLSHFAPTLAVSGFFFVAILAPNALYCDSGFSSRAELVAVSNTHYICIVFSIF